VSRCSRAAPGRAGLPRGPEIVPDAPVAVIVEVDGEEAMEMRQPLFREGVDRQCRPHVERNALRARTQFRRCVSLQSPSASQAGPMASTTRACARAWPSFHVRWTRDPSGLRPSRGVPAPGR
jgi:hypothetical protein